MEIRMEVKIRITSAKVRRHHYLNATLEMHPIGDPSLQGKTEARPVHGIGHYNMTCLVRP